MSLNLINWMECVWLSDLSPNAKYIACYLRKFMNQNHDMAWPSISRIEKETGLSRPTVIKYLDELEERRFLSRDKSSRASTTYIAMFPKEFEKALNLLTNKGALLVKQLNSASKGDLLQVVKELYPNKQEEYTSNKQHENSKKDIDSSDEQSHTKLIQDSFDFFWGIWKGCKKQIGKQDTSPKKITFDKKWKIMFNQAYFKKHSEAEFKAEINLMAEFCKQAHSISGFNRFENMQLPKFLTEKQWRDN